MPRFHLDGEQPEVERSTGEWIDMDAPEPPGRTFDCAVEIVRRSGERATGSNEDRHATGGESTEAHDR
jgi:hypothetical protein